VSEPAIIKIRSVSKRFAGNVTAVDDVSLDIRRGEFFALLGPSGCGKTTLLRMIAGFEIPSAGTILIDGADMAAVPPNRRPINMVLQSYAVFPHMTVAKNVGYGLKMEGVPQREIAPRVEEALELVKLGGYGKRLPSQLSGGQRQRVALARALIKRPKVLLLDEPLSALDAKLREAMQLELVRLQQSDGITFVIVTHYQEEALSMADRVAVMQEGVVKQLGAPAEIYEFPTSRFVADFIGKMNLWEAKVVSDGSVPSSAGLQLELAGLGRVTLPAEAPQGDSLGVAVRPEKIMLSAERPPGERICVAGQISALAYFGDTSTVFVETESGQSIQVAAQNEERQVAPKLRRGDRLWCSWKASDMLLLTA